MACHPAGRPRVRGLPQWRAASEIVLTVRCRAIDGTAVPVPQTCRRARISLPQAGDGRIDWQQGAKQIHDLVRAVAPPYPGAFTSLDGKRLRILRTRLLEEPGKRGAAVLQAEGGRLVAQCADGGRLEILECDLDGQPFDARQLGGRAVPLGATP